MKSIGHIITALLIWAAALAAAGGCVADRSEEPGAENEPKNVILRMQFNLADVDYGESRATASDDMPANTDEMMQSLRVIIVNSKGFAEHNSYWEASDASGALERKTYNFPITPNDVKTVLLLANESSLPQNVREEFSAISAAAGEWVDIDRLRRLTFSAESDCQLRRPLVMTDIHTVAIGNDALTVKTLPVTRAAVKVSVRITNFDSGSHRFDRFELRYLTAEQYLFQTPGNSFKTERTLTLSSLNKTIAGGGTTCELEPIYIPEATPGKTYEAGFRIDPPSRNPSTAWKALELTDLPRNTHVVINVSINKDAEPTVKYAVCPWASEDITIPDFN